MNAIAPRNAAARLAAIVGGVVLLAVLAAGWAGRSRFVDSLYREKVRAAEFTLDLVAAGSVLPLVAEDGLTLNSLIKGASLGERYLFVSVSDAGNVVRSDTDLSRVGSPWKGTGKGGLELSRSILFRGKPVGTVRLGLSTERLRADASRDSFPVAWILVAAILCAAAAGGIGFAVARMAGGSGGEAGSRSAMPEGEGEGDPGTARNPVTILYASVKGFRSYADESLPDDLMRNLKEIFSIASRNVLGYGGYIEKYQGESLTGVFGAPADLADHTRRAVRAAVSIQKALQEAAESGNELLRKVSIGISTGVVLSGQVPSGETSSPFYVGEIFEEAASLNRAAREGEIVISRDVYRSVQNLVAVEPLPPLGAGGGRGSWEAFRLLRIEERKNRA
ncbi:MAG: adenylate/guanylate cyclase domain-containing protein [Deltaproteobacteria bacterium]|nr:adenylate/guanylate cyclase domain-containing protein [Deltaproteobacteria bacterium]